MHRYHCCHHPPSSRCLPQVWLPCGVLALFGTNPFWLSPWNSLCYLCYYQVINLAFVDHT
uniref:Uncharacterized protein n=1 Tax=Medicago truncatula TaxID=3880 RepID=I3T6H1_MEDTR|nr:unknown [Medicago truncatula]